MGFTSFAMHVRTPEDLAHWADVIGKHNAADFDEVGEELQMYAVKKWNGSSRRVPMGLYLLAGNGGGRSLTMNFLTRNRRGREDVVLGMDDKPDDWYDTDDFVWTCDETNAVPPDTIFGGDVA